MSGDATTSGAPRSAPASARAPSSQGKTMSVRFHQAVVALALLSGVPSWAADPASTSPGDVRFFRVADADFDEFTQEPSAPQQAWMQAHYWRMLAYPPYFDSRLAWFPN